MEALALTLVIVSLSLLLWARYDTRRCLIQLNNIKSTIESLDGTSTGVMLVIVGLTASNVSFIIGDPRSVRSVIKILLEVVIIYMYVRGVMLVVSCWEIYRYSIRRVPSDLYRRL